MHLFPILVVQTVLDALTRCRVAASSHANLALSGLTPRSVMPTLRLAMDAQPFAIFLMCMTVVLQEVLHVRSYPISGTQNTFVSLADPASAFR